MGNAHACGDEAPAVHGCLRFGIPFQGSGHRIVALRTGLFGGVRRGRRGDTSHLAWHLPAPQPPAPCALSSRLPAAAALWQPRGSPGPSRGETRLHEVQTAGKGPWWDWEPNRTRTPASVLRLKRPMRGTRAYETASHAHTRLAHPSDSQSAFPRDVNETRLSDTPPLATQNATWRRCHFTVPVSLSGF